MTGASDAPIGGPRLRTRHRAREAAVQMLYQREIGQSDIEDVIRGFWLANLPGAEGASDATKAGAEKAGEVITDAAITTAVKTKLLADSKTPGLKIDVDTSDGVVTLSGTVPSKAVADKAVADARGTKGVGRVVNNLKVGS